MVFELEQPPLVFVHLKTVIPVVSAVTVLTAEPGFVMVPVPETPVHDPVPSVGEVALKVTEPVLTQIIWLLPGIETGAKLSTTIDTVLELDPQSPLLIVHLNTLVPVPVAAKLLVGMVLLLNAPDPTITDHVPVPIVTVLAARTTVGELIQITRFDPALAMSGNASTAILVVAEFRHPPLLIVHCNTLVPVPKAVTVVTATKEFVIVPWPKTTDQLPMPNVGVLPAMLALSVLIQIF